MLITYQAGAGSLTDFQEAADFFRLMHTESIVTVYFYKGGQEVARADGVSGGYAEKFLIPFDKVTIESATAQEVQFVTRLGNEVHYDQPPQGMVIISNARGEMTRAAASVGSGAAVELLPANAGRRYLLIQNNSSSGNLRLRLDGVDPAAAQGVRIPPGGYWESPALFAPSGPVRLIAESGSVEVEALEG